MSDETGRPDDRTKPGDRLWVSRLKKHVAPCCGAGIRWVTDSGDCRNCGTYVSSLDEQYAAKAEGKS